MTGRYGILTDLEPGDLIYMRGVTQAFGKCYINNLPLAAIMFETGGLDAQMFVQDPKTGNTSLYDLHRASPEASWHWSSVQVDFTITWSQSGRAAAVEIGTVIAELGGDDDVAEWSRMMMHPKGPAPW